MGSYLAFAKTRIANDQNVRVTADRNPILVISKLLAAAKEGQHQPRLDQLVACLLAVAHDVNEQRERKRY